MAKHVPALGITDDEWEKIQRRLPAEIGRKSRPAHDNRRMLNGMLHILRTGKAWRELPEHYGRWNSVYQRCRRWEQQGIWPDILDVVYDLGVTIGWRFPAITEAQEPTDSLRFRLLNIVADLADEHAPVMPSRHREKLLRRIEAGKHQVTKRSAS
ncbi:MAG: transposase [Sphingomonadaceae bacterium]